MNYIRNRFACNELDFRPEDIIDILYGHACGDPSNYPDRCEVTTPGVGTGGCQLGSKQRGYLLDKFRSGESTLSSVRDFSFWMFNTLNQALFLQAVCLPPVENSCQAENDPIHQASIEHSVAQIDEVLSVLASAEQCICPCKKIRVLSVSNQIVDGLSGFSRQPEGYYQFGVQAGGNDERNYEVVGGFGGRGSRTYNYDYKGPVVTLADTLRFRVVEEDGGVTGDNDIFDYSSPFASVTPTDWYDNTVRTWLPFSMFSLFLSLSYGVAIIMRLDGS